jgi:TolB-like protein
MECPHPPDPRPRDAGSPGDGASLAAGQVLVGRFRIRRLIGHGGTGEVYEAEDIFLRAVLALKVLRPGVDDARTMDTFRREALLARRVTHPNVCRIFDLYEHTVGAADGDRRLRFLTMELLEGETLAARLRRQGRMTSAEALPLVRDMTEALAAAHRAGVVHRDLKSANVMLVPGPPGQTRAVVTDFGLARVLDIDEASSSGAGPLVGTCAYMSPEQVEGGPVGAPADIYALGVILFEMMTGRKPFAGETALATALQRVREPPPSPRSHVGDLDPRWEKAILRCLARQPKARFLQPEEVVAALTGPTEVAGADAPVAAAGRRRIVLVAAVALVLILGLWTALRSSRPAATGPPPAETTASGPAAGTSRPSVALLGFKNLSGRADTSWLSIALSEMLRTELTKAGEVRAVPGENVARMKMELALTDSDSLARDTLSLVRRNVGADLVILGSYLDMGPEAGGRIRLDLRIQDAATGETTSALTEMGTEAEIFDLVDRLAAQLRDELGAIGAAAPSDRARRALPEDREALRLYYEGVAALRVLDADAACRLLLRAVERDRGSPLLRAALAEAWIALGVDGKARAEAEKAFEYSALLPDAERSGIEARYRETAKDWPGAVRTYTRLRQAVPDNLEYGLRLAAAQTSAGNPRDAKQTLAELRQLGGVAADDPRIDLAETDASQALSDFERMRQVAQAAAAKGSHRKARLLIARARLQEARALQYLGDHAQALGRFAEAERLFAATGDLASVAWTDISLGLMRWSDGEPEEGRLLYTRALEAFTRLGHRRGRAAALNMLAMADWKQGHLDRARAQQEQSLAIFREIDDKPGVAHLLNNLAVIAQSEGDLGRAAQLFQESLSIVRQVGDRRGIGITLANVAGVEAERGELRAARRHYEEALAITDSIGLKTSVAMTLYSLSELLARTGDADRARNGHERALTLRLQLSQKLFVAESRVALGRLSLDRRPAEAEQAARRALEEFHREGAFDDEAAARNLLASALAAQGRWEHARTEAGRALALARRSQNQLVRLTTRLAAARLDVPGAPGARPDRGRRELEQVIAEARKAGRRWVELEARLALGENRLRGGQSAASAGLGALEADAAALGFRAIAQKAGALATGAAVSASDPRR